MKNIALLFTILMTSCFNEKEITVDFPYEPRPVFYGFLGNEDGSMISAWESLPLTATEPSYPVYNGQAYLIENGFLVDTFIVDQNGIFKSCYPISESSDYRVRFNDDVNSYESDDVLLPEGNKVTAYKVSKEEGSSKAFIELNFEKPFNINDNIRFFDTAASEEAINEKETFTDNRRKVLIRFPYRGLDTTVDILKIELTYFSYEESRYQESRNQGSGIIGAASNFHNPAWTNIENAYGYVTSYVSDSLFIEL